MEIKEKRNKFKKVIFSLAPFLFIMYNLFQINMEGISETPKKKARVNYDSAFKDEWLRREEYCKWLKKIDKVTGLCILCNIKFTIKHDGEKAVRQHSNTKKHLTALKSAQNNQFITSFLPKQNTNTPEVLKIAIIELSQIYHGLKHNHSYRSVDCGIKINSLLYSDSDIGKKIHCGRTKAESIVENILAPKSIHIVLDELGVNNNQVIPFSLANDASNKGNKKMFPVAVQYFHLEKGIQNRIIDFYEDPCENSEAITTRLLNCLQKYKLELSNVSSYSADNASVNYGKNKSVYKKLTDLNPKILKSNCNCHVIHNAARHACKALSLDVENLVLKIYAEFSISSKRVKELKECFDFLELEYEHVIKHVVTRWLTLHKALEKIVNAWSAIKLYFVQQGEGNTHKIVWKFVKDSENELQDEDNNLTFAECYLYFVYHFMGLMNQHILQLEKKSITSLELHDIMSSLKNKLEIRLEDQFFSNKVNTSLEFLTASKKQKFITEAKQVYTKAIEYLVKFYDFENSPFKYFAVLNFKNENVKYQDFLDAAKYVNVKLDADKLYDEVGLLKNMFPSIKLLDLPTDKKWVKIFSSNVFTELPKLIGNILSIPTNNAYVERIFSIMGNTWTDNRNRIRVEQIKAELCVKLNFEMSCQEFYEFIKKPENAEILKAATSDQKYTWKSLSK